MTADLTGDELFMLIWLSKEDVSQLGECKGTSLDGLIAKGFASIISPEPVTDYSLVSLTDAGWAELRARNG